MSCCHPGRRAITVMVVLLLAGACGSSGAPRPSGSTSTVIALTATGGTVEGGVQRRSVKLGSTVTIRVTSDAADEIHVHGYDRKKELQPGKPGEITFKADIPGVFEVELEHVGHKLVDLTVS